MSIDGYIRRGARGIDGIKSSTYTQKKTIGQGLKTITGRQEEALRYI
jgi:hypothetical protein